MERTACRVRGVSDDVASPQGAPSGAIGRDQRKWRSRPNRRLRPRRVDEAESASNAAVSGAPAC
jgi:hypothetical protein